MSLCSCSPRGTKTTFPKPKTPWSESFDLQGDGITYDFLLGANPDLGPESLILEEKGLSGLSFKMQENLLPGQYFFGVRVRDDRDPENNWQIPFTSYFDAETGTSYWGVRSFEVQ